MKRLTSALTGVMLMAALVSGCSTVAPSAASTPSTPTASATEAPAARTTIRIASLKGPTTMGLVKLMSDAKAGQGKQDYQVTMYGTPDEIVPLIAKGEVETGATAIPELVPNKGVKMVGPVPADVLVFGSVTAAYLGPHAANAAEAQKFLRFLASPLSQISSAIAAAVPRPRPGRSAAWSDCREGCERPRKVSPLASFR